MFVISRVCRFRKAVRVSSPLVVKPLQPKLNEIKQIHKSDSGAANYWQRSAKIVKFLFTCQTENTKTI